MRRIWISTNGLTAGLKGAARYLSVLLLALALAAPATAKIYKWRDADGKLHFSDSPDNVPVEVLNDDSKEYRPDESRVNLVPTAPRPSSATPTPSESGTVAGEISIPYVAREGSASRVIVNVTFNGSVTAPILVDTGSPGLVISDDLAERLGLFEKEGSSLMVVISGVGGRQSAVRTIVDKISLGGVSEKFVPAHIVASMSDAYQGLIGMDILSNYRLTIDTANRRLLATANPAAKNLPAGRARTWWESNFREFGFYLKFWEEQASMLSGGDSPYARLTGPRRKKLENFILLQRDEAKHLYQRLDRFARWNSVPRHWRD